MFLASRLLASRVWGFWVEGLWLQDFLGFYLLDVSTFRGLELLGLGILGSRISGFKILNSGFLDASGFMFLASGL